jgi:hypothetical protein
LNAQATKAQSQNGTTVVEESWQPTVNWELVRVTKRIGEASQGYRGLMETANNAAEKSVYLAQGIRELKQMLRSGPVLELLKSLMNNPLGFMCDKPTKKDPGVYADEDIINAVTEALMRGLRFTGNEFNIIANRCYPAQAGLMRLVKEFPGLSDLELMPGIPRDDAGIKVVRFGARWKLHGREMQLKDPTGQPGVVIPVISNDYTSADALIGKATRKALARIYTMIAGVEMSEGEVEQAPTQPEPAPGPGKQSLKKPTPPATATAATTVQTEPTGPMLDEMQVQDLWNDLHQSTNPLELRAAIDAVTKARTAISREELNRLDKKISEMVKTIK